MRETRHFRALKRTIEEQGTLAGRAFDWFIQALIIISLVSFALETVPDLGEGASGALRTAETVIVAIFTLEYLLRLLVADKRLRFVFSFYGMVDLLAILPFYVATGVDLRFLRALRVFKLFRYSKAFLRFRAAVISIRHELLLFVAVAGFLLFIAAAGIYYFENPKQPEVYKSIFHSLWWAVVTLTTVGYGDMVPITAGGKAFTFFLLMVGLGVFAVPVGLITSALVRSTDDDDKPDKA